MVRVSQQNSKENNIQLFIEHFSSLHSHQVRRDRQAVEKTIRISEQNIGRVKFHHFSMLQNHYSEEQKEPVKKIKKLSKKFLKKFQKNSEKSQKKSRNFFSFF